MIAQTYDDFMNRIMDAEIAALNSEAGQDLTQDLLAGALEKNPALTPDEWSEIKQQFMVFIFREAMMNNPELLKEMGHHLWNELGGRNEN